MRKCIWTAKDSETLILVDRSEELYAEAQYANRARRYLERAQKMKFIFLGILLLFVGAMIAGTYFNNLLVSRGSLIALGGLLFVMPYATPQTIRIIGIQKSVILVRVIALGLIAWAFLGIQPS